MRIQIYIGDDGETTVFKEKNFPFIPLEEDKNSRDLSFNLDALRQIYRRDGAHIIGYMQAKHYLSLRGSKRAKSSLWEDTYMTHFSRRLCKTYGWTKGNVKKISKKIDVFVPHSYNVSEFSYDKKLEKLIDFYFSEGGMQADVDIIIEQIKEKTPQYYQTFFQVMYGDQFIPELLFVMEEDFFRNYYDFGLPIIKKLYAATKDRQRYRFQKNFWDLTAEILFNVWLKQKIKEDDNLSILYGSIIWLDTFNYSLNRKQLIKKIEADSTPLQDPKAVDYGGKVNIVLSFDDNYARHACATINSILAHTANRKDITFYILADERLRENTRKRFIDLYRKRVKLVFCDVKDDFVHQFKIINKRLSINTYYRLLAFKILPDDVKRFIWLDTDMIVCKDIIDLWNSDLYGKSIAGVEDEDSFIEIKHLLPFSDDQRYMNAGILIFDIEQAEKKHGNLEYLFTETFYKYNILWEDQDILNVAFHDDIYFLPLKWNVVSSYYYRDIHPGDDVKAMRHSFTLKDQKAAITDPAILHFTSGKSRPWRFFCRHPLKALYWYYYKQNPLYRLSFKERLKSKNNRIAIGPFGLSVYFRNKEYIFPFFKRKEKK